MTSCEIRFGEGKQVIGRIKSRFDDALPGFARRLMLSRRLSRRPWRGEPELLELPRIVRPADVALDVGANIGMYTYALSRLADKVLAFEPNPALARRLRELAIPKVEVQELALSAASGSATLSIPDWPDGHGFGTLRTSQLFGKTNYRTVSVRMCTLDSLALDQVDFIKIDVEGLEEDVLAGGLDTIRRCHPAILIELVDFFNPGSHARVNELLAQYGYEGHFLLGHWRPFAEFDLGKHHDRSRVSELKEVPRADWGYVNNILFLPPGRSIAPSGT